MESDKYIANFLPHVDGCSALPNPPTAPKYHERLHHAVDCQGTWSSWSACTSCRGGVQKRFFDITDFPLNGGRNCPNDEEQECEEESLNDEKCPYEWQSSSWSDCSVDWKKCPTKDHILWGEQTRKVSCALKNVGDAFTDRILVDEHLCTINEPMANKACHVDCPKKQSDKEEEGEGSTILWMATFSMLTLLRRHCM